MVDEPIYFGTSFSDLNLSVDKKKEHDQTSHLENFIDDDATPRPKNLHFLDDKHTRNLLPEIIVRLLRWRELKTQPLAVRDGNEEERIPSRVVERVASVPLQKKLHLAFRGKNDTFFSDLDWFKMVGKNFERGSSLAKRSSDALVPSRCLSPSILEKDLDVARASTFDFFRDERVAGKDDVCQQLKKFVDELRERKRLSRFSPLDGRVLTLGEPENNLIERLHERRVEIFSRLARYSVFEVEDEPNKPMPLKESWKKLQRGMLESQANRIWKNWQRRMLEEGETEDARVASDPKLEESSKKEKRKLEKIATQDARVAKKPELDESARKKRPAEPMVVAGPKKLKLDASAKKKRKDESGVTSDPKKLKLE